MVDNKKEKTIPAEGTEIYGFLKPDALRDGLNYEIIEFMKLHRIRIFVGKNIRLKLQDAFEVYGETLVEARIKQDEYKLKIVYEAILQISSGFITPFVLFDMKPDELPDNFFARVTKLKGSPKDKENNSVRSRYKIEIPESLVGEPRIKLLVQNRLHIADNKTENIDLKKLLKKYE